MLRTLPILLLLLLTACADAPKMLAKCDTNSSGHICGVQNPEDMDVLPSGGWFVFSEMLSEADPDNVIYGGLGAVNVESGEAIPLFNESVANWPASELPALGDKACPGRPDPARFGGHGLDVRRLNDGTVLLAAVNHGDREAIELFTVDETGEEPIATWRGCIFPEQHDIHNDVAITADGSMYFTRFLAHPHHGGMNLYKDLFKLLTGADTGFVYHWSTAGGLQTVPNSEGSASNGISISADDKMLFIAEWGTESMYRLVLNGEHVARDEIDLEVAPDNFAWSPNGKLIVTGQIGDIMTNLRCTETEPTTCDVSYGVYEVDPQTLSVTEVRKGTGAASVGLPVADQIYVGTFAGDNIQKYKLNQ